MRYKDFLSRIPENAVFWLLLFSLAFGSAGSLYQKITGQPDGYEVHPQHLSAVTTSGSLPVISLKDHISPEFLMPYGFGQSPVHFR